LEEDLEPVAERDEDAEDAPRRSGPSAERSLSKHKPINRMIPDERRDELRHGEQAYDFAYVDYQGGCGSVQSGGDQWILITDQRILYEATVRQPGEKVTFARSSGSIPITKVSFVGTATVVTGDGCDTRSRHVLRINSGGGEIELAIPSPKEASRLQRTIDDLVSAP
jgi:hypothetical protein